MAVTLSSGLQALVDAAPRTKTGYSEALRDGLGNTRRLILSKDGTVFFNVGMSGAMSLTSGNITSFGTASGVTVRQAADLLNGGGLLRIEGNGNWYQATIGLSRAAQIAARIAGGMTQAQAEAAVVQYDYYLPANPTATSGYGFASEAKIKAPRFYSSGTGPAAPPISANTPTIIELVDWTNPANPVVVGTATFSVRKDDWVYEDPTMAAEIGDVAMYTLNDTIKWTSPAPNERFELGGTLLIAANYNTEDGTQQLEQMLLSFKPYQRWPNYPFMDGVVKWTYDANGVCTNPTTGDYTYPPPFKINLYTTAGYKNGAADRTPLYTHEIKAFNDKPSGPINGPEWSQTPTPDEPAVPHFNCAQQLPWQNMRTRRSSKVGQYMPGYEPLSLSGTANDTASCNPSIPIFNEGGQQNSGNHFYAMPQWPLKNAKAEKWGTWDNAYMTSYYPGPDDPKLFRVKQVYWPDWQYSGYRWQAGSISGHDWITGFGGMRFDRYPLPTVLAHWCTDPLYVRPQGGVPIRDMVDGWGFAYFNHSNHWMQDVLNFEYLPRKYALDGDACFANAYYGGGPYGALGQKWGPDKTVDLYGLYAPNKDPKGRFPWGMWRRDGLHAHANAGLYAMLLNSPMHSIAQMHDFHTLWMSNLGQSGPAPNPAPNANLDEHLFQYRTQAWRWLGYAITWINATSHPWGFTQAELEARFALELEALYDNIYKPAFVDNNPSVYFTAIRNLGVALKASGGHLVSNGGTLGFYMVQTLVFLRQTGLWAKMRNRNTKCRASLDMFLYCYDKQIVEYVADTKMRGAYYPLVIVGKTAATAVASDVPASWAAYDTYIDAAMPPLPAATAEADSENPDRYIDFITRYTGNAKEPTGHPYYYYQYLKARLHYFPENPPAKLQAAITKFEGFMAQYDQLVSQGKGNARKTLHPPQGAILPPTVLGPNE